MTGGPIGTKKMSKEVSYNVKLFIDEGKLNEPMFSVEKVADGKIEIISPQSPKDKPPIDLLSIKDADLRLVIEDNTGAGIISSTTQKPIAIEKRDTFYFIHNSGILNVAVPLRIEVRKFIGASNEPTKPIKNGEVKAVFKFVDPAEKIDNIQGAEKRNKSPRTGKEFVKKFLDVMKSNQKGMADDNGICDFVSVSFGKGCRKLGEHIRTSRILQFQRPDGTLGPLSSGRSRDGKRARIRIKASKESGHLEGIANLFFLPPFILGDNYILKVTLRDSKGKPVLLKNEKGEKVPFFQTPVITLWKKVRIHMVVYQYSVAYISLKWNEIKSVYRDAFILVEEPLPQRVIPIKLEEWKTHLETFVYKVYQKSNWDTYKAAATTVHQNDFQNYSFPQGNSSIKGSENLTPPDEAVGDNKTWTSWDQIAELAQGIIKDKLKNDKLNPVDNLGPVEWNTFGNPADGKKIGLCVLLCKPPSPRSRVGGRFDGCKLFYAVDSWDLTKTFVHEMGHALFLNHGATRVEILHGAPGFSNGLIVKEAEGGSRGPYFCEHDSEDMVSCVMSYKNAYYKGGSILADESPFNYYDHPVDWHFCGVCLLKLRFYDPTRMEWSTNSIFRELQYSNVQTPIDASKKPLKLAYKKGGAKLTSGEVVTEIRLDNSTTIDEGDPTPKQLFALYPQEGVRNNQNCGCYKDLSFFADPKSQIAGGLKRGEWESSNPETADVELKTVNNVFCSFLKAKKVGATVIKFKISISDKQILWSEPLNVKVKPKEVY